MALSNQTGRRLIGELRSARQELLVLRAVDATVNAFMLALNAELPRRGMSPDIIWEAEQELENDDAPERSKE